MERKVARRQPARARLWMVLVAVGFIGGDVFVPGLVVEPVANGLRIELPVAGRQWEILVRALPLASVGKAEAAPAQ